MKTYIAIALFATIALAAGKPQQATQPVPIVAYENNLNDDGSYNFRFETGDGIRREESGAQKQISPEASGQTSQGSVSWKTPDGKTVTITFVADDNGYQPKVTIS